MFLDDLYKSFNDNRASQTLPYYLYMFYMTSFLALRYHTNILKRLHMVSTKLFYACIKPVLHYGLKIKDYDLEIRIRVSQII